MDDSKNSIYLTYLLDSEKAMVDTLSTISEEVFLCPSTSDSWTIAQVLEHVVNVERGILLHIQKLGSEGAFSDQQTSLTDAQVFAKSSSREVRLKSPPSLRPQEGFASKASAEEAFAAGREKILDFIQTTDLPMERISFPHPRLGILNGYSWLVFIAGHSLRHVEQIKELL